MVLSICPLTVPSWLICSLFVTLVLTICVSVLTNLFVTLTLVLTTMSVFSHSFILYLVLTNLFIALVLLTISMSVLSNSGAKVAYDSVGKIVAFDDVVACFLGFKKYFNKSLY